MENRDIRWQRLTGEQALRQLRSSASGGLGRKEARLRLRRRGENRLFAGGRAPYAPLRMLLTDPSLLLFAAVCLLTVCFGELALGLPALAVYAAWFCLMLGLALRMRADRDRLQERRVVRVCVIRDGRARRISARALVPGDVLLLRAGDVVPADCLLLESDRLRTRLVLPPVQGERPGVLVQDKSAGRVYAFGDETLPPEFENIVYGGAEVLQGSARAVVFATGARSFYGAMGRTLLPEPLSGQSALLAGVRPYLRLSGFALLALMLPLCVAGLLLSPDTQSTLRVFLPLCALAASGTAAVPCLLFSALLREPGGAVPAARTSRGTDRLPGVTDLIVMGPDGLTDGRWQFRGACNGAQTFAPEEEHSGLQPLCEAVALLLRARERLPASGMPEGERLAPLLPELVRLSGYDTAALAVRLVGLDRESNGPACRLRVRTREEAFRLCFVPDASPLAGCAAYETPSGRPAPLEPGMRERLHRFVRQAAARGEIWQPARPLRAAGALSARPLYIAGDALGRFIQAAHARRVRAAHMVPARVAEGVPGDDGDLLRAQQPVGELLARDAQPLHRGIGVEGAARLEAGHPAMVEEVDDEAAALVVLGAHLLDGGEIVRKPVVQRGDGGVLGGARRAQQRVLVDLEHGGVQLGRRADEADAPAGHGERLGKAVDDHRARAQAGQGGDRDVAAAVGQLGVDLVGNDEQVVLFDDGHERLELRARHDAARRVVGIREKQRLRARGDRPFQRLGRQDEAVLLDAAHGDGRAARQLHAGDVGDVAGVGDEDLVPRLADGAHHEVDALARADGDDDVLGRVGGAEALLHLAPHCLEAFFNFSAHGVQGLANGHF